MPSLTVAVQEQRRLFREGLALLLGSDEAVAQVVTAVTLPELADLVVEHDPDAVVLPAEPGDEGALAFVEWLRGAAPGMTAVVVHSSLGPSLARRFARAGARLVARDEGRAAIVAAVRGEAKIIDLRDGHDGDGEPAQAPLLTRREIDVLRLVASGLTTKEISEGLGISPKTVENHKQRVFWKLGVQSQAHAVAVAMRSGLLSLVQPSAGTGRDAAG